MRYDKQVTQCRVSKRDGCKLQWKQSGSEYDSTHPMLVNHLLFVWNLGIYRYGMPKLNPCSCYQASRMGRQRPHNWKDFLWIQNGRTVRWTEQGLRYSHVDMSVLGRKRYWQSLSGGVNRVTALHAIKTNGIFQVWWYTVDWMRYTENLCKDGNVSRKMPTTELLASLNMGYV